MQWQEEPQNRASLGSSSVRVQKERWSSAGSSNEHPSQRDRSVFLYVEKEEDLLARIGEKIGFPM